MSQCPNCSAPEYRTEQRIAPCTQFPGLEVPIRHCNDCGEEWENDDTFRARDHALAERMMRAAAEPGEG